MAQQQAGTLVSMGLITGVRAEKTQQITQAAREIMTADIRNGKIVVEPAGFYPTGERRPARLRDIEAYLGEKYGLTEAEAVAAQTAAEAAVEKEIQNLFEKAASLLSQKTNTGQQDLYYSVNTLIDFIEIVPRKEDDG